MKNVSIKNSLLIVLVLLVSCHRSSKNSLKETSTANKVKTINSSIIVTDSDNPNFIGNLIETQKVQNGDTVLFRNWSVNESYRTLIIHSNKSKFEILGDTLCKVYKTGEQKLIKYGITILNKTTNKNSFSINVYGILNNFQDAYSIEQPTTVPDIKKLTKTTGQLDFSCPAFTDFFVDFKLKNNAFHIIKLSSLNYKKTERVEHKLDTLIILNNDNNTIYPQSLFHALNKEKNSKRVKINNQMRANKK